MLSRRASLRWGTLRRNSLWRTPHVALWWPLYLLMHSRMSLLRLLLLRHVLVHNMLWDLEPGTTVHVGHAWVALLHVHVERRRPARVDNIRLLAGLP